MVLMLAAGVASALGCADTDPDYGPPGIIKGREVDFGIDAGVAAPNPDAAPNKAADDAFALLYATLIDATEAKGATCLPCHKMGQSPVFLGDTVAASHALFLAQNLQNLTTSRFYLKQTAHGGKTTNVLTPTQLDLTKKWSQAEAAGGAAGGGG